METFYHANEQLRSMGIREDMPTYQDTVSQPNRNYIYEGYCENCDQRKMKKERAAVLTVRTRRERSGDCPKCGYVLFWKSRELGVTEFEKHVQEWARKKVFEERPLADYEDTL